MTFVDANILLRWLLADHAELTAKAEAIVAAAKPASLIVTDIIAAEVVYVLRANGYDRTQTGEAMHLIARTPQFTYENSAAMLAAANQFVKLRLDFADCYLLARSQAGPAKVHTFDEQLRKKLE